MSPKRVSWTLSNWAPQAVDLFVCVCVEVGCDGLEISLWWGVTYCFHALLEDPTWVITTEENVGNPLVCEVAQ